MKLGVRLTALTAVLLSAVGVGATSQPASAATLVGARVCATSDHWSFTPRLSITPVFGGNATGDYTATCPFAVGATLAPPFVVPGPRGPFAGFTSNSYYGDCVAAALLSGSGAGVGAGVVVGGVVSATASSNLATYNNVAVTVLVPDTSTGSDMCSEADANGLGVTVDTL